MKRRVCCTSLENTPRCTDRMREMVSRLLSLHSTTIWRSSAKGTNAIERAGMGSESPSPMNLPSPKTVTGPLSRTESVGFLRRTALKGKPEFPRGLSAS